MKPFLNDNFLLSTATAERLYHEVAKDLPIIDYHCHLPPKDVAEDRRFGNLFEIWLEGDHYKWRAMRSNGVPEKFCTGDADPYEKFLRYAETVPHTLRNPLYHWTHLELQRYFGIDTLLSAETAPEIWQEANRQLAERDHLSARGILGRCKVAVVCTTDDPTDSLEHHQTIAESDLTTGIYPTFRPDKALNVDQPDVFNDWCDKLAEVSAKGCHNFASFLEAIEARHDFFHSMGGRLSDHGMENAYCQPCDEEAAATIFDRARTGKAALPEDKAAFATFLMVFFGELDAARGWTKQMHLGAMRNNNTRLFRELGPDIGCDSIGDFSQARALSGYLDLLDQREKLPKVVLYNLNPRDNYVFATMLGNFMDGTIPGKIQFGSGWWFLDQKEGMTWQMNALSNLGLLSRFVGMLTDSRSFMSYPRHEYFRRLLCNLIGADVENGEIPNDPALTDPLIRNICYDNARTFFGFEVPDLT